LYIQYKIKYLFIFYIQNKRYSFMVYRIDRKAVVFFLNDSYLWSQSIAYLYIYVSWHLLNCHHLSVSHLTITIRRSLSLYFFFYLNVIDSFLFYSFLLRSLSLSLYLFLFIDCRFTAMWPLPSLNQVLFFLHHLLLSSSSNNNHTHLILIQLSMIDGLTSGLYIHIFICFITVLFSSFYTTIIIRISLALISRSYYSN